MGKSTWTIEDQDEGRFSNEGNDTFDKEKGYIGVRLQQGVPLLDRDWNELEDIRRYQELVLRRYYIGNGSPDDGFRVKPLEPTGNGFKISAGRCLVDGFEAFNSTDHEIKGLELPINDIKLKVYLEVWIEQITEKTDPVTEKMDPDLNNDQDVKMDTCIRHKLKWQAKVGEPPAPGTGYDPETSGHHYYVIASISREKDRAEVLEKDIIDLRRKIGSLAGHYHAELYAKDASQPGLLVDDSGEVLISGSGLLQIAGSNRAKAKIVVNKQTGTDVTLINIAGPRHKVFDPNLTCQVKGNAKVEGILDVMGLVEAHQDLHVQGVIKSKSTVIQKLDLAESYPSDAQLEPGDVVTLDEVGCGIKLSDRPNDVKVAGVISTEPGIVLTAEKADREFPVALCGQVPCKAVNENGPIQRGDLLTTSSTPGHAMKARPIKIGDAEIYSPGTIIGKALEALSSSRGLINIMVKPC